MRRLLAYAIAEGGADWETCAFAIVATGEDLADISRVGALLRPVVDARLEGLLLLALSGAAGRQGPRSGAVAPGDLLPPPRHAAIRRRPDLSAPGSSGVDRQRDGQRRRALRVHPHVSRRRQQQPAALHRSRQRRRSRTSPRRSSRSSKRSTPNTRRSATTSTRVYLRSDKDAPNRRIIAIDLENPDPDAWKVVVPEQPHAIENAALIGGRIVIHSLVDVQSRIQLFSARRHAEGDIALPGVGAVSGLYGRSDQYDVWFSFSSPLSPATVYRYDLEIAVAHGVRGAAAADRSRRSSRRTRCSRRRRTARACRSS